MLKFQQNQTKPELICILFVTFLTLSGLTQQRRMNQRFGQKAPELLPES